MDEYFDNIETTKKHDDSPKMLHPMRVLFRVIILSPLLLLAMFSHCFLWIFEGEVDYKCSFGTMWRYVVYNAESEY
jgi:hypothetical protein